MTQGRPSTAVWFCPVACYPKPHATRKPCRLCCGWTADPRKHRITN
jgi:hypothetical protein